MDNSRRRWKSQSSTIEQLKETIQIAPRYFSIGFITIVTRDNETNPRPREVVIETQEPCFRFRFLPTRLLPGDPRKTVYTI